MRKYSLSIVFNLRGMNEYQLKHQFKGFLHEEKVKITATTDAIKWSAINIVIFPKLASSKTTFNGHFNSTSWYIKFSPTKIDTITKTILALNLTS